MSDNIKKYEVGENFFLLSVSGSSRGVDQMRQQAKRSMDRVRRRSERRNQEAVDRDETGLESSSAGTD